MKRIAVLSAMLLVGCAREPERGPVSGVVTLDGKPLPRVMVVFVPADNTPGQRSVALTDSGGRYSVFTDKDQHGASVGTHHVSLFDPQSVSDDPAPSRVPAAYTDVIRTPLKPVTVGREAQTFDIHLKSK